MAYTNKNLIKAIELLKVAEKFINSIPNKGIPNSSKYVNSYELGSAISGFIKSVEK